MTVPLSKHILVALGYFASVAILGYTAARIQPNINHAKIRRSLAKGFDRVTLNNKFSSY